MTYPNKFEVTRRNSTPAVQTITRPFSFLKRYIGITVPTAFILILTTSGFAQTPTPPASPVIRNNTVYTWTSPTETYAVPVGNGQMGGLLVANKEGLSWQINHTGFWRNDATEAAKSSDPYGTWPVGLGRLSIKWAQKADDTSRFRMALQQEKGLASLTGQSDGAEFAMENYFDPQRDLGVCVFRSRADKPITLQIELEGWRKGQRLFTKKDVYGVADSVAYARSEAENTYLRKLTKGKHTPLRNTQAVGIRIVGAPVTTLNSEPLRHRLGVTLAPRNELILYVGDQVVEAETNLSDPVKGVLALLAPTDQTTYQTIRKKSDDWWDAYWPKSYITIDSKDTVATRVEQIWYLTLYKMAVTSRGKYPAKFNSSNWLVNKDARRWGGGYWHFNQHYAFTSMLAANHLEHLDNYYNPLVASLPLLKAQSLEIWGHEGAFLHETHTPEGVAYEVNRKDIYRNNPKWTGLIFSTGLECAYQMYKYALYSGNEAYLKEKVYPFLRETALFYVHHLKKDENGVYYSYPSNGHENIWSVKNPQNDLAAIRACFPVLIQMYERYKGDTAEKKKLEEILNNLSPYPRGRWLTDRKPGFGAKITGIDTTVNMFAPAVVMLDSLVHNQHGIDSYTVYPFELTLPGKPDYPTAVTTFINRFYQPISTPLQHDIIPAALLGLPDQTRRCLIDFLKLVPNQSRGNRFKSPLLDLEMASSISLSLNLMLLQSWDQTIRLFPACPVDWNVSFKLRGEGPVLVEASRQNGTVTACTITTLKDQPMKLQNSWKTNIRVYNRNQLVGQTEGELLTWSGKAGEVYTIKPEKK